MTMMMTNLNNNPLNAVCITWFKASKYMFCKSNDCRENNTYNYRVGK